jgi:hypothetical protein
LKDILQVYRCNSGKSSLKGSTREHWSTISISLSLALGLLTCI